MKNMRSNFVRHPEHSSFIIFTKATFLTFHRTVIRPVDGVCHSDLDLLSQEVSLRLEALCCFHQTLLH